MIFNEMIISFGNVELEKNIYQKNFKHSILNVQIDEPE